MKKKQIIGLTALPIAVLLLFGCSSHPSTTAKSQENSKPVISVTTSILADVTENIVGEQAEINLLMPAGSDPHNFQLSTKDVSKMMQSDLIIENGLGLEEGFQAVLTSAESDGIQILSVGDFIDPLTNHDEHDDANEHDEVHHHGLYDPHFWHDPIRMITATEVISAKIQELPGVNAQEIQANTDSYSEQLNELDKELHEAFNSIPESNRKLVTGHHVFGYLAKRYDLEIIGSIIPSSSTLAETSAAQMSAIAKDIETQGIKAIFTDVSQSQKTAQTVISETGVDITIVPLHSESLTPTGGEADTYIDLMKSNLNQIVSALQ